jgi:hypothetical protein
MSALTNVPINLLKERFLLIKARLPISNDILNFHSSHQLAIVKLASEYCNVLVADAGFRREILGEIDITKTGKEFIESGESKSSIKKTLKSFWKNTPDILNATTQTNTLIEGIVRDKPATSISILLATVCTTALALSPVMML